MTRFIAGRRWLAGLVLLLALLAAPRPGTAQVTCTMTAPALTFGTINIASGAPAYASGNVTASCNNTGSTAITAYVCLQIGNGTGGLGSSGNRVLLNGSAQLPVELRSSATAPSQIGDDTTFPRAGPQTIPLTARATTAISFPVVGIIRPQTPLPVPGTYSSSFTATGMQMIGTSTPASSCTQVAATTQLTATATMTAQAVVGNQCTVSSTAMNFGTASVLNRNFTAVASLSVTCNANLPVTVALDYGGQGTGPTTRAMASGSNRISYGIFRDAALSQPWGNTTGTDTLSLTAGASGTVVNAYGRVVAQTSPVPGTYTDVVGVTITY